jgi:uncharacterized membrane protein
MKPLLVLTGVFALSCLAFFVFTQRVNLSVSGCIAMAAMLLFTSVAHFVFYKGMILMLPPFVLFKKAVIYLTGVFEIIGAVGLVIPSTRFVSGILLIIFFLLLLPANIYASLKNVNLEKADYSGNGLSYLWFRIPLQLFFIGWVWYFALANGSS